MDFLADEAAAHADGSENDILVPSSQTEDSIRPRKRRRIAQESCNGSDDDIDEYDLPANNYGEAGTDDPDELEYRSKYEEVMHVPQYATIQKDTFVTQLTQPWSSPTLIRGPRWKRKPNPPLPETVHRCAETNEPAVAGHIRPEPINAATQIPPHGAIEDDFEDNPELFDGYMSSELLQEDEARTLAPNNHSANKTGQSSQNLRQTTLFGIHTTHSTIAAAQSNRTHNWPLVSRVEKPTHHKIDNDAMKTWVYPTNLGTVRNYQYNIVHKGLFHNLLVALPTGLGKTFIAATVMLNWYRWTKETQIIFIAPTKPLVAQQIDACFKIAGIPRSQTTLLTGETQPAIRAEEWQGKRVFFMTPQTLVNDLKSGIADPKKIVLLVVDEAHKATGHYAYVDVVKFVQRFNSSFRVLALTATPGSSVESVQQVIDGLNISRVEIRTEDSIDIREYVHSRDEILEIFEYSLEIQEVLNLIRQALQPLQAQLLRQNATWVKDPTENTLYGLKKSQEEWGKSEAGKNAPWSIKGPLAKVFAVMMSLANSVDLLKYHGIGPFYHKMKIFADEAYGAGKYAKQIVESQPFNDMINRLRIWVNNPDFVGHPKLAYLKQVALNHFIDAGDGKGAAGGRPPSETRIMVFAHFRDSAEEIVRTLKKHEPMVRPHIFVGQSNTKGSDGMDQKMQQKIIKDFKTGIFNVLVATSIGEEGLDIGEIDLIVCYDASKSPIRMLQRMGRTGRKRAGQVHVLLMKGKEENDFARAKDNYRKMQELIESGREFNFHEDISPRIVPREIQPVVDKRFVEIPVENTQDVSVEPKRRQPKNAKKPPKKFNMPDGVETGFTFVGRGKSSKGYARASFRELDNDEATLPALAEVLLTGDEDLERKERYAEVPGAHTQFTRFPQLDAHPKVFRRLGKIDKVPHSTSSESLAIVIQKVRKHSRDCVRPIEEAVKTALQRLPRPLLPEREGVTLSSKRKPRSKRQPKTASSRTSSPVPMDDDYADLGSFIDDGCLEGGEARATDAASPDSLLCSLDLPLKPRADLEEAPFWRSQQPNDNVSDEDEELPSLDDIFTTVPSTRSGPKSRARMSKRVVDSDDDE